MKARENLNRFFPPGLLVLYLDDLHIIFENVGQAVRREQTLPEIVRLQSIRIRRIAPAIIPALIKRQEPRRLALELRAEHHLLLVQCEVDDAAPEREEFFSRIAVAPILLDRVLHRLFRQAVLQFEGGNRQAVDEEAQIQRAVLDPFPEHVDHPPFAELALDPRQKFEQRDV